MDLIRIAIERPIAILAAVLMTVMFGYVALLKIPIQLAPDVSNPVITVETIWPGGAPEEVEREIVIQQEEVLKGLEGLESMTSRSEDGRARVELEFSVGANMDRALLLTANRLDRVGNYPLEVDEPTLRAAGPEDSAIAWFIIRAAEGNTKPIHEFGDFVEDVVKDRLERIEGVSQVNVFGGSEREMQVIVRPELLSRYRLTVPDVVASLRAANASISAGDVDEGKRRYVVRSEGDLETLDDVRAVVLRSASDPVTGRLARVTVGDVAEVTFGYKEPTARIRFLGEPAIAFNATREIGANVIEIMEELRGGLDELNGREIPRAGLTLEQVYDETVYIDSSIDLVQQNIWVGGTLAALVLMLFLRSGGATLVVSLAIPVSVIGSFVAMAALGRSINVISLAGLAFAVGMVVDAAIVVLENIVRLRQEGKPIREAAYQGAKQVWGAVLVSALTTVMVFIPVLTRELEVSQLFRDIAVAISVAVVLSLLVSVTVIPALAKNLLTGEMKRGARRIPVIDDFARLFVAGCERFTRGVVRSRALALGVVAFFVGAASVATVVFLPKLEYLPEGNRNLVFGIVLPPPGYNLDTTNDIATDIENATRPYWAQETGPEAEPGEPPKISRFFYVASRATTFLGAAAVDPARASELIPVLQRPVFREPGTFGFITQPSIFGRGIGGGRSVELDISGPELEQLVGVAQRAAGLVSQVLPRSEGNQLRPQPGLELGAPEVRLTPDRIRLADSGITARDFGVTVDAFNDGMRVDEITVGNKRLDLTLKGPQDDIVETQGIGALPVVTRDGLILPAESLARIDMTAGPTEIRHRERLRTITLEIRPANQIPLEAALETIEAEVIDALLAEGVPEGVTMRMSGTADKLTQTWEAMVLDLLMAIVIVYLVMAVLFESFFYPGIIMLAVPIAMAGGIGGLALLNTMVYQPLDMLTLLGFVILIGIVVNNAILLVHQTLYHLRVEGMTAEAAIEEATRNRIRPIFMSTLTSVLGMLPLVIFPGAGSELYRGLGSVVLGGLSLSAILTLGIVPPLMSLFVRAVEGKRAAAKATPAPAE
ncbi:MAG: efflux RND transporter permease subunit [Alphaproteobacteria bacterium]|nr:efflux RND transporter permease subunit [Alphaproteobacteria bacterium]